MGNTTSELTGQKPTNCKRCSVPLTSDNWWKSYRKKNERKCIPCGNETNKISNAKHNPNNNPKNNPNRMFVNGKYIPKSHPLYKAGRYHTFEEAAFSSLQNYEKSSEGSVYIITNPAWSEWIKVGMAVDASDRCNGYQTSSPHRDYEVIHSFKTEDRRKSEREAHDLIAEHAVERKGEWFKIQPEKAIHLLNTIH